MKQIAHQTLRMEADRQKLEALRAEAYSCAPGGVKFLEWWATEQQRRPPSTDREQALVDLDAGVRRERERVVRRIYATEFRSRRDGQGLAELTRVKGECGTGAQQAGLWWDNSGGAYRGVSLAGKESDEVGLTLLEEVI